MMICLLASGEIGIGGSTVLIKDVKTTREKESSKINQTGFLEKLIDRVNIE